MPPGPSTFWAGRPGPGPRVTISLKSHETLSARRIRAVGCRISHGSMWRLFFDGFVPKYGRLARDN